MPVKPNREMLDKIEKHIMSTRRAISNAQVIIEGKDTDLWEAIRQMAANAFDSAESKLNNFQKLNDKQIWCALQERQDAKFFISMPEDFEANLEDLEKRLKTLTAEKESYRGKLAKT